MKREKLLTRQGGERLLGSRSLSGEDFVPACIQLANNQVKRHRDLAVRLLPTGAMEQNPGLFEHGSCQHCQNRTCTTRECVTRTLQFLEHDWLPMPEGDDSTSVATGMPSLASINPGSVADASCSHHSSCGFSKFSSMTSYSLYGNPEDCGSVTSRSTGIVSEEPTLRQRMRMLLLEDINEEARAETLDCLEPVIPPSRDSSNHERTRWGSPPCDTEITVCRPREHYEGASSHSNATRNGLMKGRHHDHELASRNADEAPPLPPPVKRIVSMDQSPVMPRRHCASEVYQRPRPPIDVDRRKSWDQIPYKPQRRSSETRCCV